MHQRILNKHTSHDQYVAVIPMFLSHRTDKNTMFHLPEECVTKCNAPRVLKRWKIKSTSTQLTVNC